MAAPRPVSPDGPPSSRIPNLVPPGGRKGVRRERRASGAKPAPCWPAARRRPHNTRKEGKESPISEPPDGPKVWWQRRVPAPAVGAKRRSLAAVGPRSQRPLFQFAHAFLLSGTPQSKGSPLASRSHSRLAGGQGAPGPRRRRRTQRKS